MSRCSIVAFDLALYDKADKETHRFTIADTRGPLRLTIPVKHPQGVRYWNEVFVSDHGRWWETLPIALESAYGRTPYFEFYIDRLLPIFNPAPIPVTDLCMKTDTIVRNILDIHPKIEKNTDSISTSSGVDFNTMFTLPPYWQVRQDSLGFIPGLSILDLIFNLGPEAQVYLSNLKIKESISNTIQL